MWFHLMNLYIEMNGVDSDVREKCKSRAFVATGKVQTRHAVKTGAEQSSSLLRQHFFEHCLFGEGGVASLD